MPRVIRSGRSVILAAALAVFSFSQSPSPSQVAQAAETPPAGVVSHINLVSDKSQDISTLEAWKKSYIKDGMSEQEKAIAIFNTVVRYRHQANPPREFLSSGEAGGHVHDPLKTFHVYGYGQCCCASADVIGLARYLGLETRGRDITAHSVPEIFYNNSWHLVDGSVMNYHIKPDGQLASVDEIHDAIRAWFKDHPELAGVDSKLRAFAKNGGWKNGPALLAGASRFYGKDGVNSAGWHGWPSTMQEYYKVQGPHEFCTTMGYQLNVQLRPGEKITRNFSSRGIEYTNNCSPNYYKDMKNRKLLGIQTELGDRSPGRVGDGTVQWNVPLDLAQLQTCALSLENLAATGAGVGPADAAKAGSLVLRLPSSYVYVKGQAALKANVAAGGGIVVSFSDNNGLDWKQVSRIEQSGEQTLDLSKLVQRRYDYRLRFDLNGKGTTIDALTTTNDFQCSQAALPAITEGDNQITFSAGPEEGTTTLEGSTNAKDAKNNQQLAIADLHPVLNGFEENMRMASGAGDATFVVNTPGDMKRLRISTVWRARDAKDGLEVRTSFDGGKSFEPIDNGNLSGGTKGNSRYLVTEKIPAGTRQAQVRFVGKQTNTTYLFDLRIDADCQEPSGGFRPVKITYNWDENAQAKTDVHIASSASETYSIKCGPGALVKSYTMELAQ